MLLKDWRTMSQPYEEILNRATDLMFKYLQRPHKNLNEAKTFSVKVKPNFKK